MTMAPRSHEFGYRYRLGYGPHRGRISAFVVLEANSKVVVFETDDMPAAIGEAQRLNGWAVDGDYNTWYSQVRSDFAAKTVAPGW